jgi:F1F0 ATPase subunit 2
MVMIKTMMLNSIPMSEWLWLAVSALAGALLGLAYFGGLWLTIKKLRQSARPAWLLAASYIIRLAVVLVGFYLVSAGRIERLAVSLLAFLIARFLMIRHFQPHPERSAETNGNQS